MTAKITLYSEDEIIKEMKAFAKSKNTSVSKLVNGFFKSLLNDTDKTTTNITNSLLGIIKENDISENEYKKHLEEKHL